MTGSWELTFILICASLGALFVAFNNGANDVANAFASAVGSKALKIRHALLIAAILNLCGALMLGSNVSKTLIDGISNIRYLSDPKAYITGMLSCMIAAGSFIFLSTRTGLPVSSTHAIVGGLMGISIINGGLKAVNWISFIKLAVSWIITPLLAAAVAFYTIKLIRATIFHGDHNSIMQRAYRWLPIFASIMVGALLLSMTHGSPMLQRAQLNLSSVCVLIMAIVYFITRRLTHRLTVKYADRKFGIERVFKRFQAGTSCLIGFAIGSNDVANSVTPVVIIYFIAKLGHIPESFSNFDIPIWLLMIGGIGMSIGVLSLGHKVIGTLGKSITLLTNSRGFSVDFATATTIIAASVFGIPISSTHAATGAIFGVGLENGIKGINIQLLVKIFITWLITVPTAALFTVFIYGILRFFMLIFL